MREDELWTLSQPSNWAVHKLDLNGDGLFTGTDELHDIGTFNTANELTARDIDNDTTDEFTLTYDAVGNLTDDGESYKYVYDGRGWLVEIRNRTNNNPIIRYDRYGNGWIALKTYDSDADGLLTDETAQAQIYDDRWRVTGVADEGSATIDEQWVYHHAGVNGTSSYIDAILLWDKGVTRYYPIQDTQHQDVVVLLTDTGGQVEQIRYTPYGVPFNIPKGDVTGNVALEPNGSYDFNDTSHLVSELNASNYNVLYDENLDGTFDGNDIAAFSSATGGREVLSQVGNKRGYSGTQHQTDFTATAIESRAVHILNKLGQKTQRFSNRFGSGFYSTMEITATLPPWKILRLTYPLSLKEPVTGRVSPRDPIDGDVAVSPFTMLRTDHDLSITQQGFSVRAIYTGFPNPAKCDGQGGWVVQEVRTTTATCMTLGTARECIESTAVFWEAIAMGPVGSAVTDLFEWSIDSQVRRPTTRQFGAIGVSVLVCNSDIAATSASNPANWDSDRDADCLGPGDTTTTTNTTCSRPYYWPENSSARYPFHVLTLQSTQDTNRGGGFSYAYTNVQDNGSFCTAGYPDSPTICTP